MFPQIDSIGSMLAMALLASIVGGVIIAIIAIITEQRRKMQRDDMEGTLKMEMIERGYKADEIERILAARFSSRFPRGERRNRCQHGANSDFSPSERQQSTT